MSNDPRDLAEFHWLVEMLSTIEVGLVVLDKQNRIQVWNSFMENHSGRSANSLKDKVLFNAFPELPQAWVERKIATVRQLNTRVFSSWEQRPYLFAFPNARPITGTEPWMFQNVTFCPLTGSDGQIGHVCLLIYDVTDAASSRRQLERANVQLSHLSRTDQLTGLLNRGTWESLLVNEYERHQRYHHPCALVMFDIDHFKTVNDTYGHQAGDDVLRELSERLRETLRQSDLAGRYGGEEFAVILPETDLHGAEIFAERLRQSIAETPFHTVKGLLSCTISLGAALLTDEMETVESAPQWLSRADQALYYSKEHGRNRVTAWSPGLPDMTD